MIERVSVVGVGKLGACMAAAIASKGYPVIGVDVDPKVVAALNDGRAPVYEPGLEKLIAENRHRLQATLDVDEAVQASDITFLVVPTPSEESGAFSLNFVCRAATAVGRALKNKTSSHLVVLTSTVLPGASVETIIPLLEAESGKRLGADFGYCYNPEFIALGTVIQNFLNPDFVLVGEGDSYSGSMLESFYESILDRPAPTARMNCTNAELTKLAVNTFITLKITFANLLGDLCQRLPGGDVDQVTQALGLDKRIGRLYLKSALGYGGPCFPRDNAALSHVGRHLGVDPLLAETTDKLNRQRIYDVVDLLELEVTKGSKILILGLSYKPLTNITIESQGLSIAKELTARGHKVTVYDPVADAHEDLGDNVAYSSDLNMDLKDTDALIVANPDEAFKAVAEFDFSQCLTAPIIFDCWRLFRDSLHSNPYVRYRPLGIQITSSPTTNLPTNGSLD
jgi:UDPglucose 6-dehydrogenase